MSRRCVLASCLVAFLGASNQSSAMNRSSPTWARSSRSRSTRVTSSRRQGVPRGVRSHRRSRSDSLRLQTGQRAEPDHDDRRRSPRACQRRTLYGPRGVTGPGRGDEWRIRCHPGTGHPTVARGAQDRASAGRQRACGRHEPDRLSQAASRLRPTHRHARSSRDGARRWRDREGVCGQRSNGGAHAAWYS